MTVRFRLYTSISGQAPILVAHLYLELIVINSFKLWP